MAQQLDLSPYEQWIGNDLSNDLASIRQQHPEYDFSTVTKKGRAGKPKIGMNELTNLVVNMKRDTKKISDAQSLQGAQRVARKLGKGYTAHDDDINNDGIPDVIIRDKLGRPVVVDGYTTTKSSYPYRYAYFTDFPTAEQRRDVPYSEYFTDGFKVKLFVKDFTDGFKFGWNKTKSVLEKIPVVGDVAGMIPKFDNSNNKAIKLFGSDGYYKNG